MIRVELIQEIGISKNPAKVLIYDEGNKLIKVIVAKIDLDQGLDGGYYHVVKLEEEPES
jgi:hypothetical protein